MNRIHRWLCRSSLWRCALNRKLIPWALEGIDLGDCLLEVGPGPGLTTDVLSHRVAKVTAIEIDPVLADSLKSRMAESNVTVVHGDATEMPFESASFSAVVAFTMLHHVPSPGKQDRLFSEAYRVLRPRGVFAGIDDVRSAPFRMIHYGDTCIPIDPDTLGARLECAGFVNITVEPGQGRFRFRAERSAA